MQNLMKDLVYQRDFLVLKDTQPLRICKSDMAAKNQVLEFIVIENTLDQSDCIIFQILISQKLFQVKILLFAFRKISMEAAV